MGGIAFLIFFQIHILTHGQEQFTLRLLFLQNPIELKLADGFFQLADC